ELAAIPAGQTAHVGGWLVRHQGAGRYRIDTDKGHVTGGPAEIAAHLEADRKYRDLDRPRGEAAPQRARGPAGPAAPGEPERPAGEQQAFAGLPQGARVVSLDPNTHGRHGTITKEGGRTAVRLDGDPTPVTSTAVEPLDPRHSWRRPERRAEAPAAAPG